MRYMLVISSINDVDSDDDDQDNNDDDNDACAK